LTKVPEIIPTEIPDVCIVRPLEYLDARGSFAETYNRRIFEASGMRYDFVQDNQSVSARRGTVRGLHFQTPPAAQAKLVRVLKGSVLDVAVDLRRGSPTYGRHVKRMLSSDNREQILVPEGFAHGFCTLEDNVLVFYKVSNYYSPVHERGIRWDDADLNIDWWLGGSDALLSSRDLDYPGFRNLPAFF
jgi:dTDP-4-dehydrorhamnose 3,5-epimerase